MHKSKYANLAGRKIGCWEVLSLVPKELRERPHGGVAYYVRCTLCGNEVQRTGSHLYAYTTDPRYRVGCASCAAKLRSEGVNDARDRAVCEALQEPGATLRNVGELFGLTGERVRQIRIRYLKKNPMPKPKKKRVPNLEISNPTQDAMRDVFLAYCAQLVAYWNSESRAGTTLEKLNGLMFSLLVAIDGENALPAFDLTPIQDDMPGWSKLNIAGQLHEQWPKFEPKGEQQ